MVRGVNAALPTADIADIADYMEWLRLSGASPNTLKHYRCTLIRLYYWLKRQQDVALHEATTENLTAWRAGLRVETSSVVTYMAAVRSFYEWMRRVGRTPSDPARDVPVPKRRRGVPRPIAEDPLDFAIAHAPDRIRPWLVLAAYLGLRAAEIAGLCRDDIMETAGQRFLRVVGKGDKERVLLISPYVWDVLVAAGLPRRGPLFRRADGKPGPNKPQLVSLLANTYLHNMGIPETLHQLRHRFGTAAHDAVRDLRVVQEAMGHADPRTTAGYTAFSNPRLEEAVLAVQPPRYRVAAQSSKHPARRGTHRAPRGCNPPSPRPVRDPESP